MQSVVSSLLALQEIDRDLFRAKQELARLPEERDRRQAALDDRRRAIEELEARSHDLRTRVKEIEDAAFAKRERIKKIEKAAGESRGDASLHANYEHEKRSLMREMGRGDDEALAFMERVEGIGKEMAERRAALEEMQKDFDEYSANVDSELAEVQAKVDGQEAERQERMSKDLKPETLELYDRLIIARDGDAMAPLEGNVCQGCYMSVPANTYVRLMRGVEIMQCPSCDRILYPA